jgi:diphthamide biosynthesis protein 7
MVTKQSVDTEYSCDCLEFCPISGLADIMAVGTYQVIESDLGGKTNRKGRLLLYTVTSEGVATQIQKEETGAILDLKWSSQIKNGSALLGSVTSTGNLDIYKYDANVNQLVIYYRIEKLTFYLLYQIKKKMYLIFR